MSSWIVPWRWQTHVFRTRTHWKGLKEGKMSRIFESSLPAFQFESNEMIYSDNTHETLMIFTSLLDCIREAVLMVSPKKQYLGILMPTTPATAEPVWNPTRKNIPSTFVTRSHFHYICFIQYVTYSNAYAETILGNKLVDFIAET